MLSGLGAQTASLCSARESEGRASARPGLAAASPSGGSRSLLHSCYRYHHAFATIAQIGMGGTLADTLAMAPATRALCIRRFLDHGRRLPRVFNDEIA